MSLAVTDCLIGSPTLMRKLEGGAQYITKQSSAVETESASKNMRKWKTKEDKGLPSESFNKILLTLNIFVLLQDLLIWSMALFFVWELLTKPFHAVSLLLRFLELKMYPCLV